MKTGNIYKVKDGTFRLRYMHDGVQHSKNIKANNISEAKQIANKLIKDINNNVSIDSSISIPCNDITLNSQDIVLIEGVYFKIARIQYHDNKKPHYWTLSLQRSPFNYVVEVENG